MGLTQNGFALQTKGGKVIFHRPRNARSAKPNTLPLDLQETGCVIEMSISTGGMIWPVAATELALCDAARTRISKQGIEQ